MKRLSVTVPGVVSVIDYAYTPFKDGFIDSGAKEQVFVSIKVTKMYWYWRHEELIQDASISTLKGLKAMSEESLEATFIVIGVKVVIVIGNVATI